MANRYMAQNVLEITHLRVAFSGRTVLDDVCASLPMGGMTVFVGPNGAGKTTLLLSLLGEVPYTGSVTFADGIRSHIGYVPQSLNSETYTPITCSEFLRLSFSRRPLWLGTTAAMRSRVDDALDKVGMSGMAGRSLSQLSGGQLHRVLLAGALLGGPRLLLLDEPASGVDMQGEHLFWELLDDLRKKEGISVAMVSHNLHLTAHYATHVLCVHQGTCMQGAPRDVLTAGNLMTIFGIPIHLYPDQCAASQALCPSCGAFADKEDLQYCPAGCTCAHCKTGRSLS